MAIFATAKEFLKKNAQAKDKLHDIGQINPGISTLGFRLDRKDLQGGASRADYFYVHERQAAFGIWTYASHQALSHLEGPEGIPVIPQSALDVVKVNKELKRLEQLVLPGWRDAPEGLSKEFSDPDARMEAERVLKIIMSDGLGNSAYVKSNKPTMIYFPKDKVSDVKAFLDRERSQKQHLSFI